MDYSNNEWLDTETYENEWLEEGEGTPILWMPSENGNPYQYGCNISNPTEDDHKEAQRRWAAYYVSTTPQERWLCLMMFTCKNLK